MASGHPLVLRQRAFAAKVETTAGTAVSLTSSDGAMIQYNPEIKYAISPIKRPSLSSMSQNAQVPSQRKATVSVIAEVANDGSTNAPLWATTYLAASGFAVSTATWTPASGSATAATLTCGSYIDGRLKQAAGCMFGWTMRFKAGETVMLDLKGEGVYVAPSPTALIFPSTYPAIIPPRFAGATITIGGASIVISELEIECANKIYVREDGTKANGVLAACIVDRDITVRISPEATTSKDWNADHLAGTEAALSIVLGTGVNNIITIAAPKLQLQDPPNDGDRNGVLVDDLVFQCNRDPASGTGHDNELSVTFS